MGDTNDMLQITTKMRASDKSNLYPCTKCTVKEDDHKDKRDIVAKEAAPTMCPSHQGRISETIVARFVKMTHEKEDK
jgi:hypothetical protein